LKSGVKKKEKTYASDKKVLLVTWLGLDKKEKKGRVIV
jgi:hypothetical protein